MERIASIKDERIKKARTLISSAGRKAANRCLLEGEQALQWALQAQREIVEVFVADTYTNYDLLSSLSALQIPHYQVSDGIAKKITDTNYLVPIIGVVQLPTHCSAREDNFVVVLDHVKDHGNIGAIIRSAMAFGISDIAFIHEADPYFKKTIDASRGTIFRANITEFSTTTEALKHLKKTYQIVATSPRGTHLQSLAPLQEKPIALILGNETHGVSDDILKEADLIVQMPMSSTVESLNVAVFAGLSIYELKLRILLTMLTTIIKKTLGRQVNVAGHLIQSAFDTALKKVTDLSATQVILLMIMTCDESMTRSQIEQDTGTFGDEYTALLEPLISRSYITESHEAYTITQTGKETLTKLWPIVEATEQHILEGFTDTEKEKLNEYLERIQQNCLSLVS